MNSSSANLRNSERTLAATSNYRKLKRHITWFTVDLTHTDALSVLFCSLTVCLCCIFLFIFWVFLQCNFRVMWILFLFFNSCPIIYFFTATVISKSFFFGDSRSLQNDSMLIILVLPPLLMIVYCRLFHQLTRLNVSVLSVTSIAISHCQIWFFLID